MWCWMWGSCEGAAGFRVQDLGLHPQLRVDLRDGVFWITKRIAIGQFVSEKRSAYLIERGITHILNVGEAESLAYVRSGSFQEVIDISINDLARIPDDLARKCVSSIHGILSLPDSKLYIHCIAGQNRSPTILWLYLLACGMDPDGAKQLITDRCPDAVPGHGSLVDDKLIVMIQEFGEANLRPLNDASTLQRAY